MRKPPWRIIFFGTPSFALPTQRSLLKGTDKVVAVVTQPDREKGRGRKVVISPVKELALQHGLNTLQPERAKEEAFQEVVRGLQPDLIVVVAYGQILPKSILEHPEIRSHQCPCLLASQVSGSRSHCLGDSERGESDGSDHHDDG